MSQAPDLDRGRVEELVRGNAALQERADAVANLRQQHNQLASGVAGEITGAFRSIIDGSKSAEEAMADMFKGIADKFLDMAMKILQDAITQQLMGLLQKLFGGGVSGGFGGGGGFGVTLLTSGMSFFADGGYITGPTNAMVGEGGQSEYIIPEKDMDAAMSRYSSGKRGNEVINGTGAYDVEGGVAVAEAQSASPQALQMQFEGKNYVTQDEFARGVKSAAKQGEERASVSFRTAQANAADLECDDH